MKLSELIDQAVKELKATGKSPHASKIIDELLRLKGWVYPALSTEDIALVVRCKKCKYYKRYRKKSDRKAAPFYACSLDHSKRDPMFFCADGEEKDGLEHQ